MGIQCNKTWNPSGDILTIVGFGPYYWLLAGDI